MQQQQSDNEIDMDLLAVETDEERAFIAGLRAMIEEAPTKRAACTLAKALVATLGDPEEVAVLVLGIECYAKDQWGRRYRRRK